MPDDFKPIERLEPPAPEAEVEAPKLSLGERAADLVDATNSAIGSAFHETVKAGVHLGTKLLETGEGITNAVTGSESGIAGELRDGYDAFDAETRKADGSDYDTKTIAGAVTQGGVQFVTGMIGAGKVLKGAKYFEGASLVAKGAMTGAVADSVVFDPSQARLSNLFNDLAETHPALRNPLTDFLAADENDSEATGRLKNAMEGLVAGGVIDRVLAGVRSLRKVMKTHAEKGEAAAKAEWEKQADELEATQSTQAVDGVAETKVTEALTPIDKLGKADDVVDYSKTAQPADPLLSPEAISDLTKSLKDNPDWLVDGFVNTRKAGLNLQKMDSPDGAKLAIEEVAQYLPEVKTVHFDDIKGAAEDMGMKVEDILSSGKVDSRGIAKTLIAGKMLTQSLGRQVADLARSVERMPERKAELAAAYQRFAHSLEATRSLQSEAARATAAGRIRTFDSFSDAELKAIQASGGDVSVMVKLVKEPPLWVKLTNAHNQYWINSLLSGVTTHVRNITSNTLQAIALPAERFLGGLATGDRDSIRNAAGLVMGLRSSLRDAVRLSVKASGLPDIAKGAKSGEFLSSLKSTGSSILDPGNAKLSGNEKALPISTDSFKSLKGTRMGTALDYFGQATNIPSRFLTAEDEFFKQLNYRASVHADAYAEGYAKGLRKDALADHITDALLKSMDEEGAGLNEAAMKYAQQATFTAKPEPGSFTFKLESMANSHPYLRVVLPFIRTPTNIIKAAAYRTPGLNLLSKNYRDAFSGKLGNKAKADAYGKMMTGGATIASAISLTYEGAITGKGPADPREKQILMETGWRPYSFKVNGTYVPFSGFDPAAMFFGVVADYAEARGHMNEEDNSSAAGALLMSLANNMTSKTYLLGLSQTMDAIVQPGKSGENFIKSRAASYVPSAFKQVAGLIPGLEDPYMRETRSIMDAVLNKLPGFSQALPPRRNIFGEAVTTRTAFGPNSISPFYYSEQKDDPASNELARFSHSFTAPAEVYKGIELTQVKNAKGQDFYDRWQESLSTLKVGRYNLKDRLEHLVTSEPYKRWRENEPDAIAEGFEPRTLKEVRAVIETFRQQAFRKTLQEYPEVAEQLRAAKKAQTRASAGAEIPDALMQLLNPNK